MSKPIVFMFSGQGSHYYQMGRELFHNNSVFNHWMMRADRLVGQWLRHSIVNEVYLAQHKRSETFDLITYTHPLIFAIEYAVAQVLLDSSIRPDYVLGASLGEITAAAVAGSVGFEDSLKFICRHAEQLENECPNSGGMLAVLGPVSLYETHPLLAEHTALAAINGDNHFVISGTTARMDAAEHLLKEKGVLTQRLAVTHAFHAPELAPVELACQALIAQLTFASPVVPLILCSVADRVDAVSAQTFWNSIRSPIRFRETIRRMEDRKSYTYIDLGPSGTLATLAKYNIKPPSPSVALPILTPFGQDLKNLEKLKSLGL